MLWLARSAMNSRRVVLMETAKLFNKSTDIKRGMLFRRMGATFKVMTVCDNYVMYRIKGCAANCKFWKDFVKEYYFVNTTKGE
jgi:hypothetical protein